MPVTIYLSKENLSRLDDECFYADASISDVINNILADYFFREYFDGDY